MKASTVKVLSESDLEGFFPYFSENSQLNFFSVRKTWAIMVLSTFKEKSIVYFDKWNLVRFMIRMDV